MPRMLVVISLLVLGTSAQANEPACFKDGEAYMVATYGSAYRDDEHLVIRTERYGKQLYHVARDRTSGTNHPITLLMPKQGKGLCKVLTTFPVAAITPRDYDRAGRPMTFLGRDQGLTSHEIIYAWDQAGGEFKPTQCTQVTRIDNRATTRDVSCASLLE